MSFDGRRAHLTRHLSAQERETLPLIRDEIYPNDTTEEAMHTMKILASQMANALHVLASAATTRAAPTHHVVNVARDQQPQGFHGKPSDDPEEWIEKFLSYATINGWSEDSFVARAKPMLKEIWRLYKEIINDAPVSWLEFCNLLLRHFKLSSTQATQKLHLKRLARKERRYMNLLMPRNSYSGKLVCQSPCRSYILLRSYGLSSA